MVLVGIREHAMERICMTVYQLTTQFFLERIHDSIGGVFVVIIRRLYIPPRFNDNAQVFGEGIFHIGMIYGSEHRLVAAVTICKLETTMRIGHSEVPFMPLAINDVIEFFPILSDIKGLFL
jgi:hypothetical protein